MERLEVRLIVELHLPGDSLGHHVVLLGGKRGDEHVRPGIHERLNGVAIPPHHLLKALLPQVIGTQILNGSIERRSKVGEPECAVEEHHAPIVACAALPLRALDAPAHLPLLAEQASIVIPREHKELLDVLRAIKKGVARLHVVVAHEHVERHPIHEVVDVEPLGKRVLDRGRVIVHLVEHGEKLRMVVVALRLEHLVERRFVVGRVGLELERLRVAVILEVFHLVELPITVHVMVLEVGLVKLLYLRVQAVILKHGVGAILRLVAHVEVNKLRAARSRLRDGLEQVEGELVAKTHALLLVLVEVDDGLVAPRALALFEADLVVLLRVVRRTLATNLHRGVGGKRRIAELLRQGPRLVADLQDGLAGILSHALLLVPVLGVGIDLFPGMVSALAGVATTNREVHHDHAVLVVISVDRFAVAQDIVARGRLLHRACLIGVDGAARLIVGNVLPAARKAQAQGKRACTDQRAECAA